MVTPAWSGRRHHHLAREAHSEKFVLLDAGFDHTESVYGMGYRWKPLSRIERKSMIDPIVSNPSGGTFPRRGGKPARPVAACELNR